MENMTRASATPARGSASLPGSERGTPTLSAPSFGARSNFGSFGNLRAADFGEKIKQLEDIGSRLRGEVDVILKETIATAENKQHAYETQSSTDESTVRPYTLRDLTDITSEQKTIEAMKSQLDEHGLHAESLQNRIRIASPKHSSALLPPFPQSRHYFNSNVANNNRRSDIILPPSVLERELREAREQNEWLKGQMENLHQQHATEVRDYRATTDDLKSRLYDLQTNHEKSQRLQEEERQKQNNLVSNLRDSLRQLQDANRDQEQTLLETNKKVDMTQQNYYILESAISQIRGLMHNIEQRRGRPFFDSEPVQTQSVTMLIHTVERCFQETDSELEVRTCKIRQLEQCVEDMKQSLLKQRDEFDIQMREKVHNLSMEYDTKIKELRDSEASNKRKADYMAEQVRSVHEHNEQVLQSSREHKMELESRLNDLKADIENQRRMWNEKKTALESALDASQREAACSRGERDQAVAESAELEAKLQSFMLQLSETNAVLEDEQLNRRQAFDQAAHMEKQLSSCERQLEEKRLALIKMECAVESVKKEKSNELSRIMNAEKEAGERQTQILTERLSQVTGDLENTQKQLMETRVALNEANQSLTESENASNMTKIQMEGILEEKAHLQSIVGNRTAEIDRLTSERDYYFQCLDEKTEEVSYLKAEKQRLVAQLEDRLADLKVLDQERTAQCGNYHQANESLQVRYAEKDRELEAMRSARDSVLRRLKAKDKRMKEMENDRERTSAELNGKRSELEVVYQERNQLFAELKQSRQEALDLANELEAIRISANERESQLERKLQEVTGRLEAAEGDIMRMKDSIKSKDNMDKKTVRIAGRIQKEVTTSKNQMTVLQSRLKELEENALTVDNDRRRLKDENGRLCRLMERLTSQNEKLSSELEYYLSKNEQLLSKLTHTEAVAEQAVVRSQAAERRIDEMEGNYIRKRVKKPVCQKSNSCVSNGNVPMEESSTTTTSPVTTLSKSPTSLTAGRNPAARKEVRELGDDLRTVLGDVRSLLAQHSMPRDNQTPTSKTLPNSDVGDGRSQVRISPVGQLLMERQRSTQTTNADVEDTDQFCRRLSGKIDALSKMEEGLNNKAREMSTLLEKHSNLRKPIRKENDSVNSS